MTFRELDAYLRKLRPAEIEAREGLKGASSDEIKRICADLAKNRIPINLNNQKLWRAESGKAPPPFLLRQQNRFHYSPLHRHRAVTLLYVYSGTCVQYIDDEIVEMHKGDACMFDMNVQHMILPPGENDIIICMHMYPEMLQYGFFEALGDNKLISDFILQAMKKQYDEGRFLMFRKMENSRVGWLMSAIMCEYFDKDICAHECMISFINAFFMELLRSYRSSTGALTMKIKKSGPDVMRIIAYIKQHSRTCSIDEVAAAFSYSPSYLSDLLKKSTGIGFAEIRRGYRLQHAADMLKNSSAPITDIAAQIGYSNTSHFYKIFKEHYEMTPLEYRNALVAAVPYNTAAH